MAKTQFFFYNIDPILKELSSFDLLKSFKEIKKEKEDGEVKHYDIEGYHTCMVVYDIVEQGEEAFVLGKFIASENEENYREENSGEFYDVELSEEDSKLCNIEKGALFFLVYLNKKTNKKILMFEMVHFSIGIGGFREYFKKRCSADIESFTTKQIFGRDLKSELERVSNSGLRIAKIKVSRDITIEQLKGRGVLEKAAPLLVDKDIDCEIIFKFKKGEKSFFQFLKELFHKENVTDLMQTEFGDFFRAFAFRLDNTATPKFNFFDKVFRYELPFDKIERIDEEKDIFEEMISYFKDNKEDIISQE